MRSVQVFKNERNELGEFTGNKVKDYVAKFHGWGTHCIESETGFGNFSTAIVEQEDGTVMNVLVNLVTFLEPSYSQTERTKLASDEIRTDTEERFEDADMVTEREIDAIWGNADFGGGCTRMEIIIQALLKCAGGYHQSHTSKSIAVELGLIDKETYTLTKRGQHQLWGAVGNSNAG